MALTTRPHPAAADPLAGLLAQEPIPLDTPAARRALQLGVLAARRAALARADTLLTLGRPLLVAIVAVSFLHVFGTLAAIKPADVAPLRLPDWAHHASAAALTAAIDLVALFAVAAGGVASLAGLPRRRNLGLAFFLAATFVLNAAYVVRHAPTLPAEIRGAILPALELLFVLLLPAIIPVGLTTVERTLGQLQVAKLRLTVEVTALEELVRPAARSPQNASGRVLREAAGGSAEVGGGTSAEGSGDRSAEGSAGRGAEGSGGASAEGSGDRSAEGSAGRGAEGSGGASAEGSGDRSAEGSAGGSAEGSGRPARFAPEAIREAADPSGLVRRASVIARFTCSEASADRLLAEGVATGMLVRTGRGMYRLARASPPTTEA